MDTIRIEKRSDWMSFLIGVICLGMGSVVLLFSDWRGWIWFIIGVVLIVLQFFGQRDRTIIIDDRGMTHGKKLFKWDDFDGLTVSEDFMALKLKKAKYNIVKSWFADHDRLRDLKDLAQSRNIACDIRSEESKNFNFKDISLKSYITLGVYSIYFLLLSTAVFFIDFSRDLFWFLFGMILILLTVVHLYFIKKTADTFHKTLDYKPFKILNHTALLTLIFFSAAVVIRLVFPEAESNDGIRGVATLMWLSPLMILSFTSISRNNK